MADNSDKFDFSDALGHRKVFDLKSPIQMLDKLRWELDQIKSLDDAGDRKINFATFNAAATAWHIIDWVKTFNRIYPNERTLPIDPKHYRDDVTTRCPHLRICRQISVGWKHRIVDQFNDAAVQTLAVVNIYVRMIDGKMHPSERRHRQSIAIYDGKTSIPVLEFFDGILRFWTEELLVRLKFSQEFSFDYWEQLNREP